MLSFQEYKEMKAINEGNATLPLIDILNKLEQQAKESKKLYKDLDKDQNGYRGVFSTFLSALERLETANTVFAKNLKLGEFA